MAWSCQAGALRRVTQLCLYGQNAIMERCTGETKLNRTMLAELGNLSELQMLFLHRTNKTDEVLGRLDSLSNLLLLYLLTTT